MPLFSDFQFALQADQDGSPEQPENHVDQEVEGVVMERQHRPGREDLAAWRVIAIERPTPGQVEWQAAPTLKPQCRLRRVIGDGIPTERGQHERPPEYGEHPRREQDAEQAWYRAARTDHHENGGDEIATHGDKYADWPLPCRPQCQRREYGAQRRGRFQPKSSEEGQDLKGGYRRADRDHGGQRPTFGDSAPRQHRDGKSVAAIGGVAQQPDGGDTFQDHLSMIA